MNALVKLLNNPLVNDQCIKSSLHEIESQTLARALVGLDTLHRKIFLRNASFSLKANITKLIKSSSQDSKKAIQESRKTVCCILTSYMTSGELQPQVEELKPPSLKIRTTNKHEIFASILDLSRLSHDYGLMSLETAMQKIDTSYLENYFVKKGLEYIVSGRDTKKSLSLLRQLKKRMIKKIDDHLEMIIDGMEHIHKGSSNKELVDHLKSYL